MTQVAEVPVDAAAARRYHERGYHFPVRIFTPEEAGRLRDRFVGYLDEYQAELTPLLPRERAQYFVETHLFLRWVYEIVSHQTILDAVEAVLGPDVLVWSSQWFPKMPRDPAYVSWHQDAAYWGLTPPNVVTAWVALTRSNDASGCVRVVPGSHRDLLPQRETYAASNMLSRGQEIAVEVNPADAMSLELEPGECSLHHVGIVHGSGPNESAEPRIGLAIRNISPDVVQQGRARDMVMLARGRDAHGHFDLIEPPQRDHAFGENRNHAESLARKRRNLLPDERK